MLRSLLPVGAALLAASGALAATTSCSLTNKCPKETPCCSQYGQCGIGAYCLGGCDPRMSFSLDSCVPEPQCKSQTFEMKSMDGVVKVDNYLGDPNTADWVYQGTPLVYNNESMLLTMPPNSVGTVMASTVYMWYGTVTASLKTSRGAGVVTAFILLSDVKDEIDYEFIGVDLETAQTNYYFQGIPDYDNSGNISLSDTYNNFHTYQIQWTPDTITWLVDGKVGRTKKRSETWNATTNQWDYPQSPSRVQLSIWPGGASTNAQGTINWAGGAIDWNSEDIKNYGYDFATFGKVEIECYNAKSAPGTNNAVSYTYSDAKGTNDTIVNGKKSTVLKSLKGTGLDMDAGDSSSTASSSGSSSTSTDSANTIPGGSSSGVGQGGANSGSGSSSNSGSGTSAASAATCSATGFSQDCSSTSSSSSSGSGSKSDGGRAVGGERILGASAFAVVVAVAGMLIL